MHTWKNVKIISMLITSSLLIISGVALFFCDYLIFNSILKQVLTLKPNSQVYEIWKKTPLPVTMDFYFFNWTNPEDIYNSSVMPKFEQVGPYRFKESKEKVNVTWNNSNSTVTFKHLRYWYFDEKSPRNVTDVITTLNAISLTAASKVKNWSYILRKGFSATLSTLISHIHVTKTVNEILFQGYEDTLLNMARSMPFLANEGIPNYDKFGWFYKRNGSYTFDGTLNMATGNDSNESVGKLLEWNFKNKTSFFKGNCAKISGSAGELFPPPENLEEISIFSTDMCQSMLMEHEEDSIVKSITGKKFTVGPGLLDNGTFKPENSCYCNGECVRSGLVNVSACRHGAPAFMSLPNFYKADPYYLSQIDGLKPKKELHEFFIALEPKTGIPLQVAARLQLNLLLQPVDGVRLYENLRKIFFPVLWFEQTVTLSDEFSFQINLFLTLPIIIKITAMLFIIIGICIYLRARFLISFRGNYTAVHRGKLMDIVMDGMYS